MSDYVEFRIFIADRDQRPADLTLATGSVLIAPQSGKPVMKDLQLMMPDPPQGVPATEPKALADGRQLRWSVVKPSEPFATDRPAPGTPSAYLKADLPASAASADTTATVMLKFPSGKETLDLGTVFSQ